MVPLQEKQRFQEETDLDKLVFNIHEVCEEINSDPEFAFHAQKLQNQSLCSQTANQSWHPLQTSEKIKIIFKPQQTLTSGIWLQQDPEEDK